MEWTKEKLEVLGHRYKADGPAKLAEVFGTSVVAVKLKASRLGLARKRNWSGFEWTEEMVTAFKERYVQEGAAKLSKEFGCHFSTLHKKAAELGLHTKAGRIDAGKIRSENRKTLNVHYFDQWTPNMAYVLGFLFADGSISKRQCDVVIGLAVKDENVLDFIKKETKSQRPIYRFAANRGKDKWKRQEASYLYLSSKILVQKAMELGLKPRKTYNDDPFPNVPDEMFPHFIRGYFDGDGTVFIALDKRWKSESCRIGFIGSPRFIMGIRDGLVRLAGMRHKSTHLEKEKTTVSRVLWSHPDDLRKFYSFVYPDGFGFCLERKRGKLLAWLESKVSDEGEYECL